MVNEREIYANLKVDVSRDYEVEDILKLSKEVPENEVAKDMKYIKSSCTISRVSEEKVETSVRIYLAVKKLCEKEKYDSVAFSCWPKLNA